MTLSKNISQISPNLLTQFNKNVNTSFQRQSLSSNTSEAANFFSNINTVEKMDELQKLNMDLISILDDYFDTNIWMAIQ